MIVELIDRLILVVVWFGLAETHLYLWWIHEFHLVQDLFVIFKNQHCDQLTHQYMSPYANIHVYDKAKHDRTCRCLFLST